MSDFKISSSANDAELQYVDGKLDLSKTTGDSEMVADKVTAGAVVSSGNVFSSGDAVTSSNVTAMGISC